jgi:hypothetical protein
MTVLNNPLVNLFLRIPLTLSLVMTLGEVSGIRPVTSDFD